MSSEFSVTDYAVQLTPEHEAFRKVVREFADKVIAPKAAEIDRRNEMDPEVLEKAAEIGLFGIPFPEEYGGGGGDDLMMAIAVEELTRASAACATAIIASYLVSTPLYIFGNEAQKKKYLPLLASGKKLGAHGMTEPVAGSDVAGIQSTAAKRGDSYVLNGRKMFITNGDKADIFLLFARTSPPEPGKRHRGITAFLVERGTPGFTVGQRIAVTGLRGEHPVELVFNDLSVPGENVLGEVGGGARIALTTYDHGRIGVAAQGVGLAQAALDAALKYSVQRQTFGNYLLTYQQVQFKVAEMVSAVETSRLLTYWAASLSKQGKKFVKAASIAKVTATEAAESNAHKAMLIMGGYGVSVETGVERLLRDSQVIKTYEGTNDIQRLTIVRETAREMGLPV
ncbi:MAG: acyl-CoA dehydrogenase family protein [Candidatus Marsarchaeota archaeon]|nr:acyl-CoA dehydrogenase family protein [Candidatus Marsarchaeota archaeon]